MTWRRQPVLLALLSGWLASHASAAEVTVHYPPDATLTTGDGLVHVVAELPSSTPEPALTVHVAGGAATAVAQRAADGRVVLHAAVSLTPGDNVLDLEFLSAGRPAARVTRRVFFAYPLARDLRPSPGFARRPFHRDAAEQPCAGCHETAARASDAQPPAPAQSTCFSCHAAVTRGPQVHGPAALWACTRCHDPRDPARRYATPDPPMPLCFSCHDEQKARFYGERYQHGPTATGQCVICHSPHGSPNSFFLKKPPWDLCTTCHAEKGSGRHVIAWGPNGQSHPTRGRPDPNRAGQELSCASCHNPHAAPAPKLWNFKATLWLDLCKNCHGRLIGG